MRTFTETTPSLEDFWRSIILLGRNVASYKFALGKSLLVLAHQDQEEVPLSESERTSGPVISPGTRAVTGCDWLDFAPVACIQGLGRAGGWPTRESDETVELPRNEG